MAGDDGTYVTYLPWRHLAKVRKVHPDIDERIIDARKYNYGGNYFSDSPKVAAR